MRRTITLLIVEAIIIVGLLMPTLAIAQGDSDESVMADRVASLEEQVEALSMQLNRNINHVHLDAHNASGEPVDDVNYLPETYVYPIEDSGTAAESGTDYELPADPWTYIHLAGEQ